MKREAPIGTTWDATDQGRLDPDAGQYQLIELGLFVLKSFGRELSEGRLPRPMRGRWNRVRRIRGSEILHSIAVLPNEMLRL